ncbi:MAG: hypothetical protein KGZ60_09865 [Truepera sp.]|nr:hypothetical protein [Truepera sp.]
MLTVKPGPEERTIVSGIRQWYSLQGLIGKKVVLITNLNPVTISPGLSRGRGIFCRPPL